MSVLDHRFKCEVPSDACLSAEGNGTKFELTPEWCLVVRRQTAKQWTERGHPTFNNARLIVFEDLVENIGKESFNNLMKGLLSFDFYETWLSNVA